MKRQNTPSSGGASGRRSSPGLILDSASVWQKREKHSAAPSSTASPSAKIAADSPEPATWNRYADSRLKQFHLR